MAVEKPFGLWSSPITAVQISQRTRLNDVRWDSDGKTLVWHENRGGRGVLVARSGGEAPRDLTCEESVRGGVLYGGGEFNVRNGVTIFAEASGRLFRRTLDYGRPRPITPAYGSVASPALSPNGLWVAYVFSDGQTDLLALVDSGGNEWPQKLARGADFYLDPVWAPDSKHLAWVEWDHPNMPWDRTRLCLGTLSGDGALPHLERVDVIAGQQSGVYLQPQFSPDGRWLSYIDASGEWDNLVLKDLTSDKTHTLILGNGFHLTTPAWVQGIRTYAWSCDSRRIYSIRNTRGQTSLWVVEIDTGDRVTALARQIDTGPYTWMTQLAVSPADDQLAFIASAPDIPDRIVRLDSSGLHIEARSEGETIDPGYYPHPQAISWQSKDGAKVHGLYYPPSNPDFTSTGLPPAIVAIHGGPTDQASTRFAADVAYFTSRGYGYLNVNYRGSTGYGRAYARALEGRWGDLDVEDAVGGAQALADQGLADGNRLVIRGGSAGGYTVLNALIRYPGRFKAGICLYPVSNLFTASYETHKFERHYNDRMIGPLPEAAERYRAWSPVLHVDRIRDPLLIFQGGEDRVVPPAQTESVVAALRTHGVPQFYKVYAGEGHGFRKPETIEDVLRETERFLLDYVLF